MGFNCTLCTKGSPWDCYLNHISVWIGGNPTPVSEPQNVCKFISISSTVGHSRSILFEFFRALKPLCISKVSFHFETLKLFRQWVYIRNITYLAWQNPPIVWSWKRKYFTSKSTFLMYQVRKYRNNVKDIRITRFSTAKLKVTKFYVAP